jgi:hypothetical protein
MWTWLPTLALLAAPATGEVPFPAGEVLRYVIAWPSGLDVGEATLSASLSEGSEPVWTFTFRMDAAIPGFAVSDEFRAKAGPGLCSARLEKKLSHGKRAAREETTFDRQARQATRKTVEGGGSSRFEIPECPVDALTFLYHARRELARGRIPRAQTVYFGAPYKVALQSAGALQVMLRGESVDADQFTATVQGPASEVSFVFVVARDEARTPVRITVPLEPGNFTMELAEE